MGTASTQGWRCEIACRCTGNEGHTLREVSGEEGGCLQYFKRGQSMIRSASFSKVQWLQRDRGIRGLRREARVMVRGAAEV